MKVARIGILANLIVAATLGAARAHPIAPALLELTESAGGRLAIGWKISVFRVPGVVVRPVLPPTVMPMARRPRSGRPTASRRAGT